MSGQATTWIIADTFKDTITADTLSRLQAGSDSSSENMFICLRGRQAAAAEKKFSKALKMGQALAAAGIAFRQPVAVGLQKKSGCAWLVFNNPAGLISLKNYIDLHGTRPASVILTEGKDLIDLFTDFAAGIRKAGRLPEDFNLNDALIRIDAGMPGLYLADPGRLEPKRSVSGRKKIDSYLMLDAALWGGAPSRQQIFFLRQYLAGMTHRLRSMLLRMADMLQELRFFPLHGPGASRLPGTGDLQGRVQPECAGVLAPVFENIDDLFTCADACVLKNSPTTTALLVHIPELAGPLYVKRYNKKGKLFGFKYLLRRSRAERMWSIGQKLQGLSDCLPEVLAFADRRPWGMLESAYLFTRGLSDAETLDQYAEASFPLWSSGQKRELLLAAAALIKTVHQQGLLHGDLKAKNILITHGQLRLIDLDGARLRRQPDLAERCRDLARLNSSFPDMRLVSATNRLRFLKAYLDSECQLPQAWALTVKLTEKKMKKSGRAFSR